MKRFQLLAFACSLLAIPALRANVIYTYTGNHFTSATSPFTTSDSVSGTITLSTALPTNTSLMDFSSDVVAINLTDGVDTINTINTTPGFDEFYFATSGGVITQWAVEVFNSNETVGLGTVKESPYTPADDYYEDFGERCSTACTGNNYSTVGYNNTDGGTFASQTSTAPEPSSLGLAFPAIVIAAIFRRRSVA